MSRKPDSRPARTRALLTSGLFELIQEKRWDKIRVQDVLDRTGVGRSTFYAHFDNKFDLLTANIPRQANLIVNADGTADLKPFFDHLVESRSIMWPLMSQPLLAEIIDTFQRNLADSWIEHLAALGVAEKHRGMPAQLLAGGLMSVARDWLLAGCPGDPKDKAQEFSRYAEQVIQMAASDDVSAAARQQYGR